jgi:motility quorum-sensing regulator/GCU-specific mRNA interferase toxin
MEKQTPHCKLSVVKAMIEAGNVRTTKAAREGGAALGLDFDSMIAVVMTLRNEHKLI